MKRVETPFESLKSVKKLNCCGLKSWQLGKGREREGRGAARGRSCFRHQGSRGTLQQGAAEPDLAGAARSHARRGGPKRERSARGLDGS